MKTALISLTLTLLAMPAVSSARPPRGALPAYSPTMAAARQIRMKQARQLRQIKDGIFDGRLSRREARSLNRRQRYISRKLHRYLRDGRLKAWEIRKLARLQKRAASRIRHKLNNRVVSRRYLGRLTPRRAVFTPVPLPRVVRPPTLHRPRKVYQHPRRGPKPVRRATIAI